MAEEQEGNGQGGGGSSILRILVFVLPLLVATGAGILTYMFVLAPMFAEEGSDEDGGGMIPQTGVTVAFETRFANVVMPDPEMPAATLVYQVTLEANNQTTADLIEAHKPRFYDILTKAHASLTREELDDAKATLESLQRQILQQVNDTLKRLQKNPRPDIRVTAVFHEMFSAQDTP